jgi:Tfp pilus assembly protein PilF
LQKAAQDRGNAAPDKTEPALNTGHGLTLEPITPAPRIDAAPVTGAIDTSTGKSAAAEPASHATIARTADSLRASATLYTQRSHGNSAMMWMRDHPLVVFGAAAGVFMLGYGFYIYLQAAHPSLFIHQIPAAKPQPVAVAPQPIPQPTPAPADTRLPPDVNADTGGTILPSARSVLDQRSGDASVTPTIRDDGTAARRAPTSSVQQSTPQSSSPAAAATATTPSTPQQRITVSRGDSNAPRVNPAAAEAYTALEAGRLDNAQQLYGQVLRAEPNNIDALLGLAAIAQQQGNINDATKFYLRILELEPRHALAQSAMIAMLGRSDPLAAETRLKQIAAREPSPFLYFTLGNLYADQGLWAQAQQAYFQAHHLDPDNPDYAYNLAVGLEHIGQHKLSLTFYRRAVQLASAKGRANFNLAQAQERINQLASRVE